MKIKTTQRSKIVDIVYQYRFAATYEDGTVIEQNETDVSEVDPSRSRFYDVLEKAKEVRLVSFVLKGDGTEAGVDLRDGHFEINGTPFFQHRPDLEPYTDFRIIYYRTVRRALSQDGETLAAKVLANCIGWQVTHKDESGNEKNVQRVILI